MARVIAETPFAEWLNSLLDERGWGVRTLARRMADIDSRVEVEVARRMLNRCLHEGSNPTDVNRVLIAAAFNVDASVLPDAPFRPDEAA